MAKTTPNLGPSADIPPGQVGGSVTTDPPPLAPNADTASVSLVVRIGDVAPSTATLEMPIGQMQEMLKRAQSSLGISSYETMAQSLLKDFLERLSRLPVL